MGRGRPRGEEKGRAGECILVVCADETHTHTQCHKQEGETQFCCLSFSSKYLSSARVIFSKLINLHINRRAPFLCLHLFVCVSYIMADVCLRLSTIMLFI